MGFLWIKDKYYYIVLANYNFNKKNKKIQLTSFTDVVFFLEYKRNVIEKLQQLLTVIIRTTEKWQRIKHSKKKKTKNIFTIYKKK